MLTRLLKWLHPSDGRPASGIRNPETQKSEIEELSKEALERKGRSIERLNREGVQTISHLPVIEDSVEAKSRTTEEIAHRAIAVSLTAAKGNGLDQTTVDSLVKRFGADKYFSPMEAAFIKDVAPSERDRVQYSWRYECLWVLLWTLGYVDTLDKPTGICDVPKAVSFLRERDTAQLIKGAQLRAAADILEQRDLIYRYHWAVVDARLKKKEPPAGLLGGVVYERHYALNWLIGYMEQEWDEISTDT